MTVRLARCFAGIEVLPQRRRCALGGSMEDRILFWGISILFFGILLVWFIRFFGEMGADFHKNSFARWCQGEKSAKGEPLEREEIAKIFGIALLVRLAVYLLGVIICLRLQEGQFGFSEFLASWRRWDAEHYIKLADLGYQDYIENGQHLFLVFFPLYPWVVRLFGLVIKNWDLACLTVSVLSFCIGSVYFYGVIKEEYGRKIAKYSLLMLCCYPFSFFFGGMMTESLFFCLLSAGFFYIRRHKWFAAGVIGIFCSLCRIQGILLLGVGLVEFFVTYRPVELIREKRFKEFLKAFFTKGSWLFLTVIGNLIYFGINKSVEGDFFRFRYYQKEHWYHTTTWLSNCVSEILSYARGGGRQALIEIWLPELVIFVLATVCIIYSLRRQPLRYSAFLIVYTVLNYSVTFLISGGRYMLCALPMFVVLAQMFEKQKWLLIWFATISAC